MVAFRDTRQTRPPFATCRFSACSSSGATHLEIGFAFRSLIRSQHCHIPPFCSGGYSVRRFSTRQSVLQQFAVCGPDVLACLSSDSEHTLTHSPCPAILLLVRARFSPQKLSALAEARRSLSLPRAAVSNPRRVESACNQYHYRAPLGSAGFSSCICRIKLWKSVLLRVNASL